MFKKFICALLFLTSVTAVAQTEGTADSAQKPQAASNPVVVMTTSAGVIELELMPAQAPITVRNFLRYVENGFYEGTIFHRVIDNFMIQGGGFNKDMLRKNTLPPIQNESANGLPNLRGTIAMARTNEPHSATSQFFINLKNNSALNAKSWKPGYTVFGHVINGMNVVTAVGLTQTGQQGPYRNVPVEPIIIEKVELKGAQ
ncbi:MAG: peptidylprolyl isomerase [Amphritea sp.]|nr:peptidylprolyl isomerase [Amphritea sp.]